LLSTHTNHIPTFSLPFVARNEKINYAFIFFRVSIILKTCPWIEIYAENQFSNCLRQQNKRKMHFQLRSGSVDVFHARKLHLYFERFRCCCPLWL
jgi:hypothetical protein